MSQTTTYSDGVLRQERNNAALFVGTIKNAFGNYTNSTGSEVTLTAGTIMGRVRSTGKLAKCVASATDGSQLPIGILMNNYTVADTKSQSVQILTNGDVNAALINYNGSTTLTTNLLFSDSSDAATTTVAGTIFDILTGRSIHVITFVDGSVYDN